MNRPEFMELHANCVAALGTYFVEAQRTATMLVECTAEPLTFTDRLRVMSQGIIENDAHLTYLSVKTLLYRAARLGYAN